MMWIQIRMDAHYERPPGSGRSMRIRIQIADIVKNLPGKVQKIFDFKNLKNVI